MKADRSAAAPRAPFYAFCIALPSTALLFELLTHGSLEVYFDPIPTWLHVLLVGSVPLALLLAAGQRRSGLATAGGCAAAGFAGGVSAVYTLLYLPILPLSLLGVIWFGIGLLPFAPLGGWIGSVSCGLSLAQRVPSGRRIYWGATAGAVALLALLELPGWIVAYGLETQSLTLLERWGSRGALLRAAHRGAGDVNLSAHLWHGPGPFLDFRNREEELRRNRELFFRVTGEDAFAIAPPPLPGVPAPRLFGGPRSRGWQDAGAGGTAPGLSLASSRLEVAAYGDEGFAYLEWSLVFENQRPFPQEATARLLLPPGGVVTRASLWIEGKEREAAFGPRAQVREAYEAVVRTRRDPLLVTSDRPGEATIRAFPIPPDGGTMRIRVGVSAPLALSAPERAELLLPSLGERNFAVDPALRHALWVDSRSTILAAPAGLESTASERGMPTLRGSLMLADSQALIAVAHAERGAPLWVADGAQGVIRQQAIAATGNPRRWIVAVDGSRGASPWRERIADALESLDEPALAGLVVAADEPVWLVDGAGTDRGAALERLRSFSFGGGRDNQPALEAAWDRALRQGAGVLWLCAAQPMLLQPADGLAQRLERRPEVEIAVLALETARNALLDALPRQAALTVVRFSDLRRAVAVLASGAAGDRALVRERFEEAPAGARVLRANDPIARHVTRLWASDEVERRLRRSGADAETAALAARYGLVTAASGAVVLENDAQYRAAGLDVPEGSDVDMPPVPEPSALLLFGLGLALLRVRRSWR